MANDGTGTWTNDTTAVLEKPAIDGKAKTIRFPTTTKDVIYKVFKLGTVLGQDTTWTEIPSLAFTGDGNAKTVQVPDLGLYRIGTQRTPSKPVEMNLPTQKVDYTNNVIDVNGNEPTSFKQQGRELFRDTEVPSILYSIDGKIVSRYLSNHITLSCGSGIYILKYIENNKSISKKIILSP
ncbi:MAG: T9SS type A sorting domain-containing protein [Paludibacter sp.]